MRLADGFAVVGVAVAPEAIVDVVETAGPDVVELATPPLLEHPANTTTAIAPTPAAADTLRFRPLLTYSTPLSLVPALCVVADHNRTRRQHVAREVPSPVVGAAIPIRRRSRRGCVLASTPAP